MSIHKWRRVQTKYFGEVNVPYARIQIQALDGRFHSFSLQLDSGATMGLLKFHRAGAAPLLVRSMFEVALQFESLWTDPEKLGQQYLDYTAVTIYKTVRAIAQNPSGVISMRLPSRLLAPLGSSN